MRSDDVVASWEQPGRPVALRSFAPRPEPTPTTDQPERPVRFQVRLAIGPIGIDHLDVDAVRDRVATALTERGERPLAIGSVNLDHIYHFGVRRLGALDAGGRERDLEWLLLVDGSPVARHARQQTGLAWPRLTGADLLPTLLADAERIGARVGFLGGEPDMVPALMRTLHERWPRLDVANVWTPSRQIIDDRDQSKLLARVIATARVDLLIVGLGKPRQEAWIEQHGVVTGASVLAAFGAAAGFLAGAATRAPLWMRRAGIEWTYRLACEPRRLSRRYLVQGPVSIWAMRRHSTRVTFVSEPEP